MLLCPEMRNAVCISTLNRILKLSSKDPFHTAPDLHGPALVSYPLK